MADQDARKVYKIHRREKLGGSLFPAMERFLMAINADTLAGSITPGELLLLKMTVINTGRWWRKHHIVGYEFIYCHPDIRRIYRREPFNELGLDFRSVADSLHREVPIDNLAGVGPR